jgi:hypothetical protein
MVRNNLINDIDQYGLYTYKYNDDDQGRGTDYYINKGKKGKEIHVMGEFKVVKVEPGDKEIECKSKNKNCKRLDADVRVIVKLWWVKDAGRSHERKHNRIAKEVFKEMDRFLSRKLKSKCLCKDDIEIVRTALYLTLSEYELIVTYKNHLFDVEDDIKKGRKGKAHYNRALRYALLLEIDALHIGALADEEWRNYEGTPKCRKSNRKSKK